MLTGFRTCFIHGVLFLAMAGCTGNVGQASDAGGPDSSTGGNTTGGNNTTGNGTGNGGASSTDPGGPSSCTSDASLAPARIWRITDQQYVNVVAQVFGVRVPPEVTQADTQPAEFTNFSEAPELTVHASVATAYQLAARNAAQAAVASNLAVFLPCGPGAPTDACVASFIRNRVARAFGRPLTDTEVEDLLGLYHLGQADSTATGIRLVIEAALQAPSFLYRSEVGAAPGSVPQGKVTLNPHELAGAISFALLDSVPDDALWRRAQDGSLLDPAVLAVEVDRLLALPVVQANLASKAGFWLGVEKLRSIVPKDTALFPEFTADVQRDLYASAQRFVQDLFASGSVSDLLSSPRMYLNSRLAGVYGIPGVNSAELVPMDLQLPERNAGILTQPAVLAAWSHPDRGDVVHRGLFIYNALVCGNQIPGPPPNVADVAATFPADATERELSNLRATHAAGCGSCHGFFDPLGLATERYDAIGRYKPVDAMGRATDSSSTILGLGPDLDGPVSDLSDLVTKLKNGRRVSDCAARNLAVFVLGRSVTNDTTCALKEVTDRLASTGSFTDYYRAMLTSPGFRTRDVGP